MIAPAGPGVVVRTATPGDVTAIAALEAENLGPDSWPEHFVDAGVRGDVPTAHYLVATRADVVVGYAATSIVADLAELQRIAVTPGHRRLGVATALVTAVGGAGRAAGADRVLLEVREDNAAALAFYAGLGFAEIHRRPRYYRDGTTAVVLALGLAGDPTLGHPPR